MIAEARHVHPTIPLAVADLTELPNHDARFDGVAIALEAVGFEVTARLERAPRASERHAQRFVLAAAV